MKDARAGAAKAARARFFSNIVFVTVVYKLLSSLYSFSRPAVWKRVASVRTSPVDRPHVESPFRDLRTGLSTKSLA